MLIGVKLGISLVMAGTMIISTPAYSQENQKGNYPASPIEFVVHTNPGDSIDIFLRNLAEILARKGLVNQPIQVVNKVGGSSAVANAYVVGKKARVTHSSAVSPAK